jgi:hypothetical protein
MLLALWCARACPRVPLQPFNPTSAHAHEPATRTSIKKLLCTNHTKRHAAGRSGALARAPLHPACVQAHISTRACTSNTRKHKKPYCTGHTKRHAAGHLSAHARAPAHSRMCLVAHYHSRMHQQHVQTSQLQCTNHKKRHAAGLSFAHARVPAHLSGLGLHAFNRTEHTRMHPQHAHPACVQAHIGTRACTSNTLKHHKAVMHPVHA